MLVLFIQDVELIVKFLPELVAVMVDNTLRGLYKQLKEEHTPYSPSASFFSCLAKQPCAMYIMCTYALHLLEKKDMKSLSLLLPMIAKTCEHSDPVSIPDVFLHVLVLELTQQIETLREAVLHSTLNEFWVPCSQSNETVLLHFCRLLWTFHGRLNPAYLAEVLEAVNPSEEVGLWSSVYTTVCVTLSIMHLPSAFTCNNPLAHMHAHTHTHTHTHTVPAESSCERPV